MKKYINARRVFAILMVITVAIALVFICDRISHSKGEGYTTTIRWEYVNVREGHSTNYKILETIYRGQKVDLTGERYEYFGGDSYTDVWLQVRLDDGTIGWLVASSVNH